MTTTTLHSQRASPRCCGRGLAWKALLEAGWHGFRASAAIKRSEAAPRVSLPRTARRGAAPGGGRSGESDPTFRPLVRHGGGQRGTGVGTPFAPPAGRSLSPQRSLAGRPSSRPASRLEQQQTTDGHRPRGASLEEARNPTSPIGSTGSLPARLTVLGEASSGSNHHRTGPSTS